MEAFRKPPSKAPPKRKREAAPPKAPKEKAPPKQKAYSKAMDEGFLAFCANPENLVGLDKPLPKPLAPSTEEQMRSLRANYLRNAAGYFKITIEQAEKKLFSQGAEPPEFLFIQAYFQYRSHQGKSALNDPDRPQGWTESYARKNWKLMCSMQKRETGKPFPTDYTEGMDNTIKAWAKEGKLQTAAKEKYTLRFEDFVNIMMAIFLAIARIPNAIMRIQMCLLLAILYLTGQRPGTITEALGYKGTGQCLTWGDTRLFYTGKDDHNGPKFHLLFRFRFLKGARYNDAFEVRLPLRSLNRDNMHVDPIMYYIFLGDRLGVFRVNVTDTFIKADPSTLPTFVPHEIFIKDEFKKEPIFTNTNGTAPMTYTLANQLFKKGCESLGLRRVNFYMCRVGLATQTIKGGETVWKTQFLLGHKEKSHLAVNSYQSRYVGVDVCANMVPGETPNVAVMEDILNSSAGEQQLTHQPNRFERGRIAEVLGTMLSKATAFANDFHAKRAIMITAVGEEGEVKDPDHPAVLDYRDALMDTQTLFGEALNNLSVGKPTLSAPTISVSVPELVIDAFVPAFMTFRYEAAAIATAAEDEDSFPCPTIGNELFDHPLASVIRDAGNKPGVKMFERLENEISYSDSLKAGLCPFCVMAGRETPDSASDGMGSHMFACEQDARKGEETRCNLCLSFILNVPEDENDPDYEVRASAWDNHFSACFKKFLADFLQKFKEGEEGEDEDEDEDEEETDGPPASKKVKVDVAPFRLIEETGLAPFRLTSLTNGKARAKLSRVFCYDCLFDESLPWPERLRVEFFARNVHNHARIHWCFSSEFTPDDATESKVNYTKELPCHIPPCDGTVVRVAREHIQHLQEEHSIKLIECTRSHVHNDSSDPCCLDLPERFFYTEQAKVLAEHTQLGLPMPDACLIDYRTSSLRSSWKQRLVKYIKNLPSNYEYDASNWSAPVCPPKRGRRRAPKPKSKHRLQVPDSTESPPPTPGPSTSSGTASTSSGVASTSSATVPTPSVLVPTAETFTFRVDSDTGPLALSSLCSTGDFNDPIPPSTVFSFLPASMTSPAVPAPLTSMPALMTPPPPQFDSTFTAPPAFSSFLYDDPWSNPWADSAPSAPVPSFDKEDDSGYFS